MAGTVDVLQRCYTGLELRGDVLWLEPRLPKPLRRLRLFVRYRGQSLTLDLERDAVHPEPELGLAPGPLLGLEVVRVGDQDLLAERERPAEALAGPVEPGRHGFVELLDTICCCHGRPPGSASGRAVRRHTERSPPTRPGQEATHEIPHLR